MEREVRRAILSDDAEALQEVLNIYDVDVDVQLFYDPVLEKLTALHYAVKKGSIKTMDVLLAAGYDTNLGTEQSKKTPLLLAAEHPDSDVSCAMAKKLLAHGTDVNQIGVYGRTVLHYAAIAGHVKMAELLCEHGANVNQGDKAAETPLIDAAKRNHVEVVNYLCQHGAHVNQAGSWTPLASAALWGHVNVVKALCEQGVAFKRGSEDVLQLILESHSLLVRRASTEAYLAVVEMLIAKGDCMLHAMPEHFRIAPFLKVGKEFVAHLNLRQDAFCRCLMLLLSAGSRVSENDLRMMRSSELSPLLTSRGILEYATSTCGVPTSLRRLCKFAIRTQVAKPLARNLPRTGLPEYLLKYILLQVP